MAKGRKTGGRRPGSPNVVTREMRAALQLVAEHKLEDLERWITETGDGFEVVKLQKDGSQVTIRVGKDPGKAADLMMGLMEHFVPKLQRHEHTGEDGGPVEFVVRDLGKG